MMLILIGLTISKFHKYAMVKSKLISIKMHEFQILYRKAKLTECKFFRSDKVQVLVDSLPLPNQVKHLAKAKP